MKRTTFFVCFLLAASLSVFSQEYNYKFRLTIKDKKSDYSIDKPEDFLSAKSLERRQKYNIKIDETDLPISQEYIKAIESI